MLASRVSLEEDGEPRIARRPDGLQGLQGLERPQTLQAGTNRLRRGQTKRVFLSGAGRGLGGGVGRDRGLLVRPVWQGIVQMRGAAPEISRRCEPFRPSAASSRCVSAFNVARASEESNVSGRTEGAMGESPIGRARFVRRMGEIPAGLGSEQGFDAESKKAAQPLHYPCAEGWDEYAVAHMPAARENEETA